MRLHLHSHSSQEHDLGLFKKNSNKTCYYLFFMLMILQAFSSQSSAQGTWTALTNLAPHNNGGVMLVLSDGKIMCKSTFGGVDGYGTKCDRLTPAVFGGSYAGGTWDTTIKRMYDTRLYFSSQVLKDGRVYVCGGEYGTGGSKGETYNPKTNLWTATPLPGARVSDANSEILENGKVLQALVSGTLKSNLLWTPSTNTYGAAPSCLGIHNECAWIKLPDNSILMVDRNTTKSERYIPSLNAWVADANVPVALYDPYGLETGGAVLLPNGKAFFIGSLGHNAIYTPSGNSSPGTWVAAADIPNAQGVPDGPCAMMRDGKVLLATSPKPTSGNHFPSPTSFYEYNYLTNTFTQVNAPGGGLTINMPCYKANFTDLPNGQVLYSRQGSKQYYVYTPAGSALASGKPTISSVALVGRGVYKIKGKLFNGISQGANYGDDWQMNTNYPLVRLSTGFSVYYARTYNWNSTGVRRTSIKLSDSAYFTLPAGLAHGTYSLVVVANGIASSSVSFTYGPEPGGEIVAQNTENSDNIATSSISWSRIYPNPASREATIQFSLAKTSTISLKLFDMEGKVMKEIFTGTMQGGDHSMKMNVEQFPKGLYFVRMITESGTTNLKLTIQ